jgi:hypothetical protein
MHQLHHLLDLFSLPSISEKNARSPAMNTLEQKQNVSLILGSTHAGSSAIVAMY